MPGSLKKRNFAWDGGKLILPSVLSADLLNLGRDVKSVIKGGADRIHLDIMDGHFVPNLSFGPAFAKAIRTCVSVPVEAHLMLSNPEDFVKPFADAGVDLITVHLEAIKANPALLKKIRRMGLGVGISIKPDHSVEELGPFLKYVDLVLLMTVFPGFGGQEFLPGSEKRIAGAAGLIKSSRRKILLEVDGGINLETARRAARAGADAFVAGNAVFGAKSPEKAVRELRKCIL